MYKTCQNCECSGHCKWFMDMQVTHYEPMTCNAWQGWRDPLQVLPKNNKDVLIKINLDNIEFVAEGYYRVSGNDFYIYTVGLVEPEQVIAWRTIPE